MYFYYNHPTPPFNPSQIHSLEAFSRIRVHFVCFYNVLSSVSSTHIVDDCGVSYCSITGLTLRQPAAIDCQQLLS